MAPTAAPDVDLKKQGLPSHVIIGAVVAFLALFVGFHSRGGEASTPTEDEEASASMRLIWILLWLLWRLFQLVLLLGVSLLGVLVTKQRSILYVPVPPGTTRSTKENPSPYRSPKNFGLQYEDLTIVSEDGTRLNAWLVYHPVEKCRDQVPFTAVYFHGNAGNIGHRLENIRDMHQKLRLNILIVDYRGYGDSEDGPGPTEKGFMMDAMATYRWLVDRIRDPPASEMTRFSADRILLFGRSIGGSVAIKLAALLLEQRLAAGSSGVKPLPLPAGLILENTFTSLRDMATTIFPFLKVVKPLLRAPLVLDEWRASEALSYLSANHQHWCVCLLSGLQDKIVPPIQMRQLHGVLTENRPQVLKFFVFKDGGHNDTPHLGGAEYWASFAKFMLLAHESEEARLQARQEANLSS